MFGFLISALPILIPVLCTVAVEMFFLYAIRRRDGKIDLSELGVAFSGVISIYALFPAVTFLAGGLEYTLLSDTRLFKAQPSPADLAPIFWFYFLYLASFAWAYVHFRGSAPLRKLEIPKPSPKLIWILLFGYLSIRLFFIVIRMVWNIQAPESYGDEYLLYRNLPLLLQQLANHLGWMSLTTELLLMAALTLNYRKYRVFIFGWLAAEFLAIAIFGVGSRTGLMMELMTFAITYHLFVKKINLRVMSLLCFAALLLFVILGFFRMISAGGSVEADATFLASSNEFEALFANAYDLRQLKAADETSDIFPGLYFADLANLIPQQLVPFKKIDLGEWYVQTFYPDYADVGGGFAFGVIPESIVGLGWIDLIWRGLLVGWAFSYIYRRFAAGTTSFWEYSFYVWATIFSYQTFRATTFVLVPHAVYDVLTVMLAAKVASRSVAWVLNTPSATASAVKLSPESP